jgi:hypothetical protein
MQAEAIMQPEDAPGKGAETLSHPVSFAMDRGAGLSNVIICLRVRDAAIRTRQHGVLKARRRKCRNLMAN